MFLYLVEEPDARTVVVPDFLGMQRQQASDTALRMGLHILVTGNPEISPQVSVTAQNIPAGTTVDAGTTVTLEFTDTAARD